MKKVLFFITLILIITSCAKKLSYDHIKNSNLKDELTASEESEKGGQKQKKEQEKSPGEKDIKSTIDDRKIIKTGSITYIVDNFTGIEKRVTNEVKAKNGYIYSSNYSENSLTIVIKLPVAEFDDFLSGALDYGRVINKYVDTEDVTSQYFDLEGKIKNKRVHQERVREYLRSAKNIDEMLKVENELNRITTELEGLEGSYKNLSNLISYSTLTLLFNLKAIKKTYRALPSVKQGFSNFGAFLIKFFYYLMFIIIFLIIFFLILVILIITGGFIYYIMFGKIGILKKLLKFFK